MNDCVIVDLDGTLCDTRHRLHHVKGKHRNYEAFHDACVHDKPHGYLVKLLSVIAMQLPIILCSGRPDSHRRVTVEWLERQGIWWQRLHMRKAGDYRPDVVIKREMLDKIRAEGFNPLVAIDDRPTVVAMWRDNDVPCLVVDDSEWHK